MGEMASQITSITIVYSTVYSDADQRKHQSSASLAFVRGIHRGLVNSLHKWPVTQKMFPFHYVIMWLLQMSWQQISARPSAFTMLILHCSSVTTWSYCITYILSAQAGPHVGPMNLAIRVVYIKTWMKWELWNENYEMRTWMKLRIHKKHHPCLRSHSSARCIGFMFLTLGLFGRRVIVVTCVCPSVRLSVCLSVCSHHPC